MNFGSVLVDIQPDSLNCGQIFQIILNILCHISHPIEILSFNHHPLGLGADAHHPFKSGSGIGT